MEEQARLEYCPWDAKCRAGDPWARPIVVTWPGNNTAFAPVPSSTSCCAETPPQSTSSGTVDSSPCRLSFPQGTLGPCPQWG